MADNLIYIPNDDTQNHPFCRLQSVVKTLNTQLKPTILNSIKENVIVRLWGLV